MVPERPPHACTVCQATGHLQLATHATSPLGSPPHSLPMEGLRLPAAPHVFATCSESSPFLADFLQHSTLPEQASIGVHLCCPLLPVMGRGHGELCRHEALGAVASVLVQESPIFTTAPEVQVSLLACEQIPETSQIRTHPVTQLILLLTDQRSHTKPLWALCGNQPLSTGWFHRMVLCVAQGGRAWHQTLFPLGLAHCNPFSVISIIHSFLPFIVQLEVRAEMGCKTVRHFCYGKKSFKFFSSSPVKVNLQNGFIFK